MQLSLASYRSALDVFAYLWDTFILFYLYFTLRDKWNMMRKHCTVGMFAYDALKGGITAQHAGI